MRKNINRIFLILLLALSVLLIPSCSSTRNMVETSSLVKPNMPTLPLVTENMDFFKDGYEIVTLESISDGDTASFRLKTGAYRTRFLSVNTPETANGIEPWGFKAKEFTTSILQNAKTIILEKDPKLPAESTFDHYDRLLAHVWVDGELLQYKLIEESLATAKYFYDDYRYNNILASLAAYVKEVDNRRVFNPLDIDPSYDYENKVHLLSIADLNKSYVGKTVKIRGVVTGVVDTDFFLEDKASGKAIYVYGKNIKYSAIEVGNEVELVGKYTVYNGLPEISSLEGKPTIISKNNSVAALYTDLSNLNEDTLGVLIEISGLKVVEISGRTVSVEKNNLTGQLYIDSSTGINPYLLFKIGKSYDIKGNVSVYKDQYQIIIRSQQDIIEN